MFLTFATVLGFLPLATKEVANLSSEKPEARLEWRLDLKDTKAEKVWVEVELGGDDVASTTTIKAEDRRLMALNVSVPKGGAQKVAFYVECHSPQILNAQGEVTGKVTLKTREVDAKSWDRALSLEFLGDHPRVRKITTEVLNTCPVPVIYIAGDSTVTDQAHEPYMAWGQVLPLFTGAKACVANHAESGLSLKSFRGSHRLDKILSELKSGDFVLIQFGHNDQKEKGEGVGAFTTYAKSLRDYIAAIKSKGGRPVLVTAVGRRRFNDQGQVVESLGDFPAAVRQVAQEEKLPLIDLNELSKRLYQRLGVEGTLPVFLHYEANTFPGQTEPLKDDTHFSAYGAYAIARCVLVGAKQNVPELADLLTVPADDFSPENPKVLETLKIPARPYVKAPKPDGK